jgi:branched-subunit amino acid transport protein
MMNLWIVIPLMAGVTFLPRLIPLLLLKDRKLPPLMKRMLNTIPYAALGALILPGVLHSVPTLPWAAVAGMGAALIVAWYRGGLIASVASSVLVVFVILLVAV